MAREVLRLIDSRGMMNALMILVQGVDGGVMSQGCRGLGALFVVINGNVYSLSKLELNQTLEFLLFHFLPIYF